MRSLPDCTGMWTWRASTSSSAWARDERARDVARMRARVAQARELRHVARRSRAAARRSCALAASSASACVSDRARSSTVWPSSVTSRAPPATQRAISAMISSARAVALGAARVRDDAERAALVAALHRRDERADLRAPGSRRAREEARRVEVEDGARDAVAPCSRVGAATRAARRCCRGRPARSTMRGAASSFSPSCCATQPATASTSVGCLRS